MTNEKRFIFIISIFLLIMFILKAILHGENREVIIKLKSPAYVKENIIKLKDISLIIGDKSLKNIKITTSPQAGQFIYINKNFVKNVILNKTNKKIKIFGPENIKVVRQSFIYSKELIEKLIIKFLENNSKKIFKNGKWEIIQIISPPRIILPYENADIKISCNNENVTNRLVLFISFLKNNTLIKKVNAIVFFKLFKKVVIAKKDIKPRQIITKNLVEVKEVPIKNFNNHYFEKISDVVGKQSIRFIRIGDLISPNMVRIPPVIKRGSLVKVIATDGGIIISTIAKALENGKINSNIRVMNLNSGKIFIGKVVAPNEVMVRF